MAHHYADVVLPLPLDTTFTYRVPETMQASLTEGMRVSVSFGHSKTYLALVVRVHDDTPDFEAKDILAVVDDKPVVLPLQWQLWRWIAQYYMAAIGDVYGAALPVGLKNEDGYRPRTETYLTLAAEYREEQALHRALDGMRRAYAQHKAFIAFLSLSHWDTLEGSTAATTPVDVSREVLVNESRVSTAQVKALIDRGLLMAYEREVKRINEGDEPHPELIKQLSTAQQEAYNKIVFKHLANDVVLLHGVTSSGKTEIYVHLMQKALDARQQVLYLLPEIALTVQMRQRLQTVFGSRIGIYHSKYNDAERVEIWNKQLSAAPYDIILGARSAVFLPFQRLGLVIIDEEHETSFKQQDPAPRYHARSVALMLARMCGAKTVLGSATPSMESLYNAQHGKYGYVSLTTRFSDIAMPKITVVDIRDLQKRKMMNGPFSPTLLSSIRQALAADKQVILFQNRRGFAPMIECKTCGWVPKCRNCDVSLTYHRNMNILTCHYCGYTYHLPEKCPACEERELRAVGFGTEKIEEQIARLFPEARLARMDLDTTHTRAAYEQIIDDFSSGRTNMLIGTQMVTKGLDFKNVRVVGILQADNLLNYPDFRAYEHAYMMMAQVSGRAGRQGEQGEVILQTKNPELPLIQQVVKHDWRTLYHELCEERSTFRYPPFTRLIYVYLKHRDNDVVQSAAIMMGSMLKQQLGTRVLGPDRPPVARVKTQHIRKLMLKIEPSLPLDDVRRCLQSIRSQVLAAKRYASVQIYFDVDPQ